MTNEEILQNVDAAVDHLKKTTVSYPTWLKNFEAGKYPKGSQWGDAFDELQAIHTALTPTPTPTPIPTPTPSTDYPTAPQGKLTLNDGNFGSSSGVFSRDAGGIEITGGRYTRYTGYGVAQMAWNGRAVPSTAQSKIHDLQADTIQAASSMGGTGEACLWLGNWTHAYNISVFGGKWMNVWTGAACWNSVIEDIKIGDTPNIPLYMEHDTVGCTFRRIEIDAPSGGNPGNMEWSYGGHGSHNNTFKQMRIYVPKDKWFFLDAGSYGNTFGEIYLYGPGNGLAVPANLVDSSQPNQIDWSTIDTTNLAGAKYKAHNNQIGAQHVPMRAAELEPGTVRMPTSLEHRMALIAA
jgi:hypothetical protein